MELASLKSEIKKSLCSMEKLEEELSLNKPYFIFVNQMI